MRAYEKEAVELELLLRFKGILNENTSRFSLTELVNFFGVNYLQYGPLFLMDAVPAALPNYSTSAEYGKALPDALRVALGRSYTSPIVIPAESVEIVEKSVPVRPVYPLSKGQEEAWNKLQTWVKTDQPYFVLRGFAGTGKTYLMQKLSELGASVYYSAPTNKAAKVLGQMVGCTAKTTYSLLGLKMEHREDKLVLTQGGNVPYFPQGSIIVIDEASMVGSALIEQINLVRARCGVKILYVGDPAQLNPVGEARSPAWAVTKDQECRALLTETVRFDNQLLVLATALRGCIKEKNWLSPLRSDHDDSKGVWKWRTQEQFEKNLLLRAERGDVLDLKTVAWRNKTVNRYNHLIRQRLGYSGTAFCPGDVILLAKPVESNGSLIAHTDDEFTVMGVDEATIKIDDVGHVDVWQLQAKGDQSMILTVARDQSQLDLILTRKANTARKAPQGTARRLAWKDFWETDSRFNKVRYGWALTAHRAQGSTYGTVFVDQMDILANENKPEAYRCFYVGATRASTAVHSF